MDSITRKISTAILTLAVAATATLTSPQHATATEKHGNNCSKCHSLSKKEARDLLTYNQPLNTIEILSVTPAPIKGLWQVIAKKEEKKGIFYVDITKTYVINGEIHNPRKQQNLTLSAMENTISIKTPATITRNALILGNKNARIKAAVFTDPQCPHCAKLHEELKKVVAQRKDIAFNIILYPLSNLHPTSYDQAKSIYCKKSIAALEEAYSGKAQTFATCDARAIDENIAFGQKYGITGTPTIVLSDGTISYGYLNSKSVISLLEAKRNGTENTSSQQAAGGK